MARYMISLAVKLVAAYHRMFVASAVHTALIAWSLKQHRNIIFFLTYYFHLNRGGVLYSQHTDRIISTLTEVVFTTVYTWERAGSRLRKYFWGSLLFRPSWSADRSVQVYSQCSTARCTTVQCTTVRPLQHRTLNQQYSVQLCGHCSTARCTSSAA